MLYMWDLSVSRPMFYFMPQYITEYSHIQKGSSKKVNLLIHITEKSRDLFVFQKNWIRGHQNSISAPQLCFPVWWLHPQGGSHLRAALRSFRFTYYSTASLVEWMLFLPVSPLEFCELDGKPGVSHVLIDPIKFELLYRQSVLESVFEIFCDCRSALLSHLFPLSSLVHWLAYSLAYISNEYTSLLFNCFTSEPLLFWDLP